MRVLTFAVASLVSTLATASDVRIALVAGTVEITGLPPGEDDRWAELVRVTVHDERTPNAHRPAVVGTYEIEGDVLRFRPIFAFAPGMSYRVEVEGAEPTSTILHVPANVGVPVTRVDRVFPSTDLLPENQLKVYIHFSASMSGGDGLRFVRLVDENGNEVLDPFLPLGEHFWDHDRRRYTIFFDPGRVKRGILPNEQLGRPIQEGKRYRLLVDPDWRDAQGLPLAEAFEKSFRVGEADEEPLDPATWSLTAPGAGAREPFIVDFAEPLDHEILVRALEVEDASGAFISGQHEISRNETRWSFSPSEPWREGSYHLVVLGILEDLAGNRIGRPFEVDVFEAVRPEEQQSYRIPFAVVPVSR